MTIRFHSLGAEAIGRIAAGATEGLICTPYYSERGLELLNPFFGAAEKVEFWTRFSPLDWRSGVADMAALKRRVQSVLNRGKTFDIRISDDLHAKIYSFSQDSVIIGSANLTWPAMRNSNIEVICELTESEASLFLDSLPTLRARLTPIAAELFAAYVDVAADAITRPSDGSVEEDGEMNAAIGLAEETLRESLAPTAPEAGEIRPLELEQFVDYCRTENTDASREIVARYDGRHNLQWHVKHCYYGALRFLSHSPDFVAEIASTPGVSLYSFTEPSVRIRWRDFLREHATEIDKERDFSFRTLRVYLPTNLGGVCSGGGGASGTLKRVLPIVARMLQQI